MLCWLWNVWALWHCSEWAICMLLQSNIHKCLLCYAQEDTDKNLLLSVNERSKQTWDSGLKIDIHNKEALLHVFRWASLVQLCRCVLKSLCLCNCICFIVINCPDLSRSDYFFCEANFLSGLVSSRNRREKCWTVFTIVPVMKFTLDQSLQLKSPTVTHTFTHIPTHKSYTKLWSSPNMILMQVMGDEVHSHRSV